MKLLFFEMREVCYNSYTYFAEMLAHEFIKNGHEVDFFRISEEPLRIWKILRVHIMMQ